MGVDNVAVGISNDLTGVELHDAARTLDVDRISRVATGAIRIDEGRPGVALIDGLAIGGDRGVIVVMHDRLDGVALLIKEYIKEPVLMLDGNDDVKTPGSRGAHLGVGEAFGGVEGPTDGLRRIGCWDKAEYGDHIDRKDHGLSDQGGQVVQPGDLGVQEGRSTDPADGDHPVVRIGEWSMESLSLVPDGRVHDDNCLVRAPSTSGLERETPR
jgi:hypothetical protein